MAYTSYKNKIYACNAKKTGENPLIVEGIPYLKNGVKPSFLVFMGKLRGDFFFHDYNRHYLFKKRWK